MEIHQKEVTTPSKQKIQQSNKIEKGDELITWIEEKITVKDYVQKTHHEIRFRNGDERTDIRTGHSKCPKEEVMQDIYILRKRWEKQLSNFTQEKSAGILFYESTI